MSLPENIPLQFPSGRWGFVGRVRGDLAYVQVDGTTATETQLETARRCGPRLARLKTRSFATKAEALAALDRKAATV